jgi:hypothetical protein
MGAGELTVSDGSETDTIAGMGAGELTVLNGSETYAASAGMGAGGSSDVVSLSFHWVDVITYFASIAAFHYGFPGKLC